MPNESNSNNPQTQFRTAITPTQMWIQLLAFQYAGQAAYQKTNQAFIDEWNNAIDLYGRIFSGITLVATPGNGFPNFAGPALPSRPGLRRNAPSPDQDARRKRPFWHISCSRPSGAPMRKRCRRAE